MVDNKKIILIIFVIVLLLFLGFAILYLRLAYNKSPLIDENYLTMDRGLQLRQGLNQCGPYSVMAAINILTQKVISPNEIDKFMNWRLKNRMTLPFGLVESLKEYGLKSKQKLLILFSDEQRVKFLKAKISEGSPVILLNKTDGIQHYFTVAGFDKENFYLYDSLQELGDDPESRITIDDNGNLPGNRTYTKDELLYLWSLGGKYFFRWYVISVSSLK
jgi:hypothetical protein